MTERFENERQFQTAIMREAIANGWLGYCHPDSRKSASISTPGFPDIILINHKRNYIMVLEAKMPRRKPSPEQLQWLSFFLKALLGSRWNFAIGLVRPRTWPKIKRVIQKEGYDNSRR